MSNGRVDYGPNVALNLNCSKAGINYVNGTNYSPLCALDSQGMCTFGIDIPSKCVYKLESVSFIVSDSNQPFFVVHSVPDK